MHGESWVTAHGGGGGGQEGLPYKSKILKRTPYKKVPESRLVGVAKINPHPAISHINEKFQTIKIKISGDSHSSCHFLLNPERYQDNFTGGHFILWHPKWY